jgi:biopolymer transport protein TolR
MRRRTRRTNAQMNVVPYIDVMLVLLVIFMVVAPMIQTKVLNLPSVAKATAAQEPPLIVEMDAQGVLRLSQANGTQQFTDTTQLIGTLQQSLHNKPQPVVLAADKAVAYGDVMRVMDALKSAQIERVGLLLKQSQTTQ